MTFKFLPDAFYASKYQPWLSERSVSTFDNEKERKKMQDSEDQNTYNKHRMMHGKKKTGHSKDSPTYKQFVAKAKETGLKRGEVKRYDKDKKKWISNKK